MRTVNADQTWITRSQAKKLLDISDAQLRRDQRVLLELGVKGFDYQPYEEGFTLEAFNVLNEFRELVREKGRKRAISEINQKMEQIYDRS
ncbi:hypothetical protein [Coleofasciculus sp. FACHB-SPT9]|uniref:hypothetical protein n=1 Tax=Cyanophyceae TaxID=3028117 RepID=UPI00168855A9|nr:hypothetical protein [Coleofasciculus sp. FACHB-SPT9]MBD1887949.1 hypothetical protein [Coleofasciculus sp. FACHB-SPT9]